MVAVHPEPPSDLDGVVPSGSPEANVSTRSQEAGEQPLEDRGDDSNPMFTLVHPGNAHEGKLAQICVFGKPYDVCWRSLFIFPVNRGFRQKVLILVLWKWFDRFILFLILLNSVLLATYQNRASDEDTWNWIIDTVVDPILAILFTMEFVLKVIAWGFFLDRQSYLREPWNWLDFIVVVTANISFIPGLDSGLGFLRLFRILRPLRSLKQVPQMKVLVNTLISSIPRMANVTIMMFFFFWIFGIIGITLLDGIFYHGCRTTPAPYLRDDGASKCWEWPLTGDERLCGGRYMCESPPEGVERGYCGGLVDDPNKSVRPEFPGGRQDYPWCEEPKKIFPESDFVHFDHMGGALITVFQCMTMEGWTDIMYKIQDGFDLWMGTLYFCTLIPITSFFLLNVALAVVDEAREDFDDSKDNDDGGASEVHSDGSQPSKQMGEEEETVEFMDLPPLDEDLWLDCAAVRVLRLIAFNEVFTNFIMFFIAGNVVTMMLESYPPEVARQDLLSICEKVFLGIFCGEMVVMLGAMGLKRYVMNPVTCFDGIIVIISLIQVIVGGGSAFTALRTFRLVRVMNKLASRWPSFRVLLKAMVQTGISLNYWLVLFFLFLYICTLMWMNFFEKQFHFTDTDSFEAASADQGQPWCAGTEAHEDTAYRQECIPRAHFDTFLWAFVTIFQIMTGENWNSIMYAGMRAQNPAFALLFIALIVFGQILFLSLFLSMLMSKFNEVQDNLERQESMKFLRNANNSQVQLQCRACCQSVLSCLLRPCARNSKDDDDDDLPVEEAERPESLPEAAANQGSKADGHLVMKPKLRPKGAEDEGAGHSLQETLPGQPDLPGVEAPPKMGSAPHSPEEVSAHKPRQAGLEDGDAKPPGAQPPKLEAPEESTPSGAATPKGSVPLVPTEEQPVLMLDKGSCRQRWPHGYAWFVLSQSNPLRRGCQWILAKQVNFLGSDINAFDNFILLCILISTLGMALDFPLRDPSDLLTKVLRKADFVFKIIFIIEMALKLLAMGLVWGRNAYLRSGWNWLDGIVVAVSIMGMVSSGSGSFLKTLRIVRTLRPLRVISRNQNLKVVVQTIFASMPALVTLVIVCVVFLLIFALFALSYLKGTFYQCEAGSATVALEQAFETSTHTTPLCLTPTINETSIHSACPRGMYSRNTGSKGMWIQDNVPCSRHENMASCQHRHQDMTLPWQRASADTPICVGRCTLENNGNTPDWLCPRRYRLQAELPHNCAGSSRAVSPELLAAEEVGMKYRSAMTRSLVMPCGGTAVNATTGDLVVDAASAVSCRSAFCPGEVRAARAASCEANCRKHPYFCLDTDTCKDASSPQCQSCRKECEAACQCEEYCEPLVRDAALCYEQGGSWAPSLPQNFNNIWNSLLTLFEISSTEGWVDVMYAACDARMVYQEPKRDHQAWLFAPFFVIYIFVSFMFLLNLSVGVIVDSFIDLKQSGRVLLTPAQERWLKSQKTLLSKALVFHMRNLHLLPRVRRRVYDLVVSKQFDTGMTIAIVANTCIMATKSHPWLTPWWEDAIQGLDYVFTFIFTVEFGLKYYAYRSRYWMDSWNRFDFLCVVAAICGAVVSVAAPAFELGKQFAQIFRIFRVARLFRLLRSERLNKIFMALILSLPKLANVLMILLLLLILYSILGISLFSTVKHSEWLNVHGNFMHFGWAFITLFRAVTGEAWNSIMHDLMKTEMDYFRDGSWCTPDEFFDTSTEHGYDMLKDKCLLDLPNSCMQSVFGLNILPAIYWVTYILFIQLMVMNLVIAVILEGYEDGKASAESEVIDLCIKTWEKYDSDHRMTLPLGQALEFINDVVLAWMAKRGSKNRDMQGCLRKSLSSSTETFDLSNLPMKYANYFQLITSEDGQVHWLHASKQVLRFTCTDTDVNIIKEIDEVETHMDKRAVATLGKLMGKRSKMLGVQETDNVDLRATVAATKLQRYFRDRSKMWKTAEFNAAIQNQATNKQQQALQQPPPPG